MSTVHQGLSIALRDGKDGPEDAGASGIQVHFTRGCPLPYGMVGKAHIVQELQKYEYSSPWGCPLPHGMVDKARMMQKLQEYENSLPGVVHFLK